MADGSSRTITLKMSTPAVNLDITGSADNGNPVTITWNSISSGSAGSGTGSIVKPIANLFPGDDLTITFTATDSIPVTQHFDSIGVIVTLNVVLKNAYTNIKVSRDVNLPNAVIEYIIMNPDYSSGNQIIIGVIPSTGYTIVRAPVGGTITFYYQSGTTWLRASQDIPITYDLATTPYVLNFYVPKTIASINFKSVAPAITNSAYYIRITARQCTNYTCTTYATLSTQISSLVQNRWFNLRVGENLTFQMQYVRTSDSVVLYDKTINKGTVTDDVYVVIGQTDFFDLPVTIQTSPSGARASTYPSPNIGGTTLGYTPITLSAPNGAGWGEVADIEFVLNGYVTLRKTYTFTPENHDIYETLTPMSWSIPVTSVPTGATVTEINYTDPITGVVSNKVWGNTPTFVTASYGDVISLTYSLTGYQPVTRSDIHITGPACISSTTLQLAPVPAPNIYLDQTVTVTPAPPATASVGNEITVIGRLWNIGTAQGTAIVYVRLGTRLVATSPTYTVAADGGYQRFTLYFDVPIGTTAGNYQVCLSLT
jgi:hypothetical protein